MSNILDRLKENQRWLLRDGFETSANNAREAIDEITALREQVEKLTKERDEYKHEAHCCNIEYGDVHDSYTQVSEELAALAEQVDKLTKERDEYKSGFEAAASKYRNLKLQMQEIINVC